MKALASYSIKGGVGKTTAAVNLAYEASRSGARVLLWDLDPQGAATFFFRVKPGVRGGVERLLGRRGELAAHVRESDYVGLHLVPADFSLRHLDLRLDGTKRATRRLAELLEPLDDDYDVALLDCPAGLSFASEVVFETVDALLVPTVPTPLSVRTLDQLVEFLDGADLRPGRRPEVWPFVSMFDWRKALHRDLLETLAVAQPPFFPTAVPNSSAVERMGRLLQPVGAASPRTTAARGFKALWSEIAARLWP
ncbi:ParA family protein [Desertimonas flava]|uniref:ParA family protein n=1 Tax=Desertimonas flava TaxID=2064846 RepID=UPI000E34FD5D|nr:ParA family protein [Desertimonas flava]